MARIPRHIPLARAEWRGLESRVHRSARALPLVLLLGAAATCKSGPSLEVDVSTGQEKGELSLDPKIARVDIEAKSADGKIDVTASATPGGTFDLGKLNDTTLLTFTLTGYAADGKTKLAAGRS